MQHRLAGDDQGEEKDAQDAHAAHKDGIHVEICKVRTYGAPSPESHKSSPARGSKDIKVVVAGQTQMGDTEYHGPRTEPHRSARSVLTTEKMFRGQQVHPFRNWHPGNWTSIARKYNWPLVLCVK